MQLEKSTDLRNDKEEKTYGYIHLRREFFSKEISNKELAQFLNDDSNELIPPLISSHEEGII